MTRAYRGICPVCGRELGLTRGAGRIPPHVQPAPVGGRCPGSREFPTTPTGATP